jgi:hypothetical protein
MCVYSKRPSHLLHVPCCMLGYVFPYYWRPHAIGSLGTQSSMHDCGTAATQSSSQQPRPPSAFPDTAGKMRRSRIVGPTVRYAIFERSGIHSLFRTFPIMITVKHTLPRQKNNRAASDNTRLLGRYIASSKGSASTAAHL